MQYSDDSPEGRVSPAPGAQPQAVGEVPAGAPPSNTAPANCNQGSPVAILRAGIDSLYLSYAGRASFDIDLKLRALKEAAQSPDPRIQAAAVLPLGMHLFEVWDRGSGRFPFVLVDNAFFIAIKGISAKQLPLAHVQVSSEWLLGRGVQAAVAELDRIIPLLGELDEAPLHVSRADLYCDFIPTWPLQEISAKAWVSRAKQVATYTDQRVITGYTIGQGGDISARLYDKTAEIKVSGKEYWETVWRREGMFPGDTVWRLEFQLRRAVLAAHGVETVADLIRLSGPLWRYATESWLRLTIPSDSDATQSRWPMHPNWEALSRCEWAGSGDGVSVPVRPDRAPSDSYLFENGLSGITSFMAREGINDPREGFEGFWKAAERYHMDRSDFTAIDFAGYLRERAAMKARQYNRRYPEVDERSQEIMRDAYADEYRKRKDGE